KEYLISKLIQYAIFLVCIATMLSVFQFSKGNLDTNSQFEEVVQQGYELGEIDNGGGAIGTAIAFALIGLLGEIGTVILCIGIAAILLVFMFGIKPAEMIAEFIETRRENREERRIEKEEIRASRAKETEN